LKYAFTSHFFYAKYKKSAKSSPTLSIYKVFYVCMKCDIATASDYKSKSVMIALFQSIGTKVLFHMKNAPLDVVKIYSKLISWGPSMEVRLRSLTDLSQKKLTFDDQYKLFKKYGVPTNLETIPMLITLIHSNMTEKVDEDKKWIPTIKVLQSTNLPFVIWMTEHYEFITCSPLRPLKEQESAYFKVFDKSTWALIVLSVVMSATLVRTILLCSKNPNQQVSH